MSDAWGYWKANGAMSEADYPYTARDRADGECLIDSAAITVSTTDSWGYVRNSKTNVSSVVAELKNGPMAVAVNSGNKCWRFYKGGLLTEEKEAEPESTTPSPLLLLQQQQRAMVLTREMILRRNSLLRNQFVWRKKLARQSKRNARERPKQRSQSSNAVQTEETISSRQTEKVSIS